MVKANANRGGFAKLQRYRLRGQYFGKAQRSGLESRRVGKRSATAWEADRSGKRSTTFWEADRSDKYAALACQSPRGHTVALPMRRKSHRLRGLRCMGNLQHDIYVNLAKPNQLKLPLNWAVFTAVLREKLQNSRTLQ